MKKQLMLLALTLGTHLYAQTVKDALGTQGQEYLAIINGATIQPLQEPTRKKLNKRLDQNLNAVTPAELNGLAAMLEDFATVVAPLLKQTKTSLSPEEFGTLVRQVRAQLEALAIHEQRITTTIATQSNPASFLNPLNNQTPGTDRMPEMLVTYGVDLDEILLADNVRILNQMSKNNESSSDIDANTVTEGYKSIFEDLIKNAWTQLDGKLSEQDCQKLLQLFFNDLNLTSDDYDAVLPAFTDALVTLQNEMWEASEGLATPVHPSLLGRTSNKPNHLQEISSANTHLPEITVIDADEQARREARIDRVVRTEAAHFNEIKQMLAKDLRHLESDLDEIAAKREMKVLLAQLTEKTNTLLEKLDANERKKELIKIMLMSFEKSQNPVAELSPHNAAALLHLETNYYLLGEIRELLGENESTLQTALPMHLSKSEKDALTQYILTLLSPTKRTQKDFATDVQRLNRASESSDVITKFASIDTFVNRYRNTLENFIDRCWEQNNNSFLSREELQEGLLSLFENMGMAESDYVYALPALTNALVTLQDEMWNSLEPVVEELKRKRDKGNWATIKSAPKTQRRGEIQPQEETNTAIEPTVEDPKMEESEITRLMQSLKEKAASAIQTIKNKVGYSKDGGWSLESSPTNQDTKEPLPVNQDTKWWDYKKWWDQIY